MIVFQNFPIIHFDFGAISVLEGEVRARFITRPLIITDTGLVEHGIADVVCSALSGISNLKSYETVFLQIRLLLVLKGRKVFTEIIIVTG